MTHGVSQDIDWANLNVVIAVETYIGKNVTIHTLEKGGGERSVCMCVRVKERVMICEDYVN